MWVSLKFLSRLTNSVCFLCTLTIALAALPYAVIEGFDTVSFGAFGRCPDMDF